MDTLQADLSVPPATPDGDATPMVLRVVSESAVASLAELYAERVRLTPDDVAFRYHEDAERGWADSSWRDLQARAERYVAGFCAAGLSPGDRVGVHIANQPDWFAIDWALQQLGLVMVALYSDDTGASMAHMLADSGARLAILKNEDDWRVVRQSHSLPELEGVVLHRGGMAGGELRAQLLGGWLPDGRPMPPARAAASAMATIVYTSGATGVPKGVMLSHANILANVFACLRAIPSQAGDLRLSVLPLAHMFERTSGAYVSVAGGACTVFGRGSMLIGEDLREQRPTVMVAVPRVYEKIHGLLLSELEHGPSARRALFRMAVEAGWRAQRRDVPLGQQRWLPLVLTRRVGQQLLDKLGGRLRIAVSGGAPLSPEIARTFIALGLPVLQGYGLSEASPVVSANRLDDNEPGSVGRPLDNVETRVGPGGELLVRGPTVMMGYWRDKDSTERAIDAAGWLHTGDKISRLDTARLYLTGRIKELIVTATGEKAAPAEIETRLRQLPAVDQIMVVGEARPYLGALLVPEARAWAELCRQLHIDAENPDAAELQKAEDALLAQCRELLRSAPKNHQVRRIAVVRTPWTIASGLLTPSLKLRRAAIERACPEEIDRIYAGHLLAARTDCSRNTGMS